MAEKSLYISLLTITALNNHPSLINGVALTMVMIVDVAYERCMHNKRFPWPCYVEWFHRMHCGAHSEMLFLSLLKSELQLAGERDETRRVHSSTFRISQTLYLFRDSHHLKFWSIMYFCPLIRVLKIVRHLKSSEQDACLSFVCYFSISPVFCFFIIISRFCISSMYRYVWFA